MVLTEKKEVIDKDEKTNSHFKIINSRATNFIGYDEEKRIMMVSYNVWKSLSGKTVLYHGVEPQTYYQIVNSLSIPREIESFSL